MTKKRKKKVSATVINISNFNLVNNGQAIYNQIYRLTSVTPNTYWVGTVTKTLSAFPYTTILDMIGSSSSGVSSVIAGTGISVSAATGNVTITNTLPDQTVVLNSGTGISVTGTYPNFTITNTAPDTGLQSFTASGDATAPSSTSNLALTLATVNSNIGTFGSATKTVTVTVNGKGLITAISEQSITGFISNTLTSSHILVGNGSNVATDVAMSGEATIANTGAVTLTNSAVIGKVLTGYVSGAGTVSATDTILQAIQKLNGNTSALVTGVSSVNSLTGAVPLTGTSKQISISAANVFSIPSGAEISIAKATNLTTNGFVKTSGSDGTLSVDTSTYLTAVTGTTNRITVTGGSTIDISSSYVGQNTITTLGTVTTGTWSATAIANSKGGTGIDTSGSTGIAQVSSGTWSVSTALASGTTATTQSTNDNSTKVATTAYTDVQATNDIIKGYQSLGSAIKGIPLGMGIDRVTTSANLSNQELRFMPVYIPYTQTITGVKWWQVTAGNYTSSNYNGVGLYSYSGGTLTLVASSTDDGNIWKATGNTLGSKAFSSTYSANAGLYFVAMLWCRSAVTTTPALGVNASFAGTVATTIDFTNSAKLSGYVSSQTSFPSTQAMSGVTASSNIYFWVALY